MMLTFLKNLKSQNNQSKKKKRQKLLKMQLYFLMEGKTFSIPLKVEYFQKKNKEKDLQVFYISQLPQLTSKIPHSKVSDRRQFKVLTPEQLLERLPIALVQVKASNTSEKLLNQIRQII